MSWSVILPYLGALIAVTCGTLKGHMDILLSVGLWCCLGQGCCQRLCLGLWPYYSQPSKVMPIPESGPPYGAMLVSESLTTTRATPISVAFTATGSLCDIQTWAATKGHVLVHGPTTA